MESRGGMSSLTRGHNRCKGTETGIYLAALTEREQVGWRLLSNRKVKRKEEGRSQGPCRA